MRKLIPFILPASLLPQLLTQPEIPMGAPSVRVVPENGHVLIPQGPNYLDTTTNQQFLPVAPDTLLNLQTGGILFVPDAPAGDD